MLKKTNANISPRHLIEPQPELLYKLTRILDALDKGSNDQAKAALADAQVALWLSGMRKVVLVP